jgi:enoyl-[acyl-carrier protein] reductase I
MLSGKKALIAGVTNKFSLGWAIAQALHQAGATVMVTYVGERFERNVLKLVEELPGCLAAPLDVQYDEQIDALFMRVQRDLGGLDILIHAMAYAPGMDWTSRAYVETSRETFHVTMDVSAYSLTALAQRAAPLMAARGGGSIITLTYLGGERVVPQYNVMGVAKAALDASVKYLAHDLGPQNIRVNAISPGPVSTAAARGIAGFLKGQQVVTEASPLHRKTDPAEVGATAAFLCSDGATGITGEVIHLDSGYHVMGRVAAVESE